MPRMAKKTLANLAPVAIDPTLSAMSDLTLVPATIWAEAQPIAPVVAPEDEAPELPGELETALTETSRDLNAAILGFTVLCDLGSFTRPTVKELVYTAFSVNTPYSHKELANLVCAILPMANTSHKSVASMKVDWRGSRGAAPTNERPRGQVQAIVYELLAQGGMTAQEIADEVRARVPSAMTSHKSVASMKVDWKAAGGMVRGLAPAQVQLASTAEFLAL